MRRFLRGCVAFAALAGSIGLPASTDAGTQYQYDALGRLMRVTYETGVVVQYSYDAAGNRSQVATSGVNRAPVANNDTANATVSAAVDIMVLANDSELDGDPLTVTAVGAPSGGGTVAVQGGGTHVRYSAPTTPGAKTFTYTISDGRGGSASATVTVNVTATNQVPVAVNDTAVVTASMAVDIMVRANDSDPDGDALTVTAVGVPSGGGAVSIQGGGTHVRYIAPATAGTKSFTYKISDGRGGTATATATVNVTVPNRPPVAVKDLAHVERLTTAPIMVLANDSDPDGQPLTVLSVTTPTKGSVFIAGSGDHVLYDAPGLTGIYSFHYTASDGAGGTATGAVTVFVQEQDPDCLTASLVDEAMAPPPGCF